MQHRSVRPSFKALTIHIAKVLLGFLFKKSPRPRTHVGKTSILFDQDANDLLSSIVLGNSGALVSRLGTTENAVVRHYLENQIDGKCKFPPELKKSIRELSGFFPPEDHLLERFSRETVTHLQEVDVMGVRSRATETGFWEFETFFIDKFSTKAKLVELGMLMPIGSPNSWTRTLRGKKVLVIHPFAESIETQFNLRREIFPIYDFLPDFELQVLKAVQSIGDNHEEVGFKSWFEALDAMRADISSRTFDVALVGAGAYGLFLAAECKKIGKPAIHIGGALQLLFGIKGKRWTDPSETSSAEVLPFVNEYWSSPLQKEVPSGAFKVEGGCYWN
jgi:hypothetical protein